MVVDIACQYARRDDLTTALAARPDDRVAHTALRRHVQVRDRSCVAPGCQRPARHCEVDHTIDHATGGRTVAENSGPLCLRHHTVKHEGRWRLDQPRPGRFRWTSPLGQTYWCRGEPITPPTIHVPPRLARPGPPPRPEAADTEEPPF